MAHSWKAARGRILVASIIVSCIYSSPDASASGPDAKKEASGSGNSAHGVVVSLDDERWRQPVPYEWSEGIDDIGVNGRGQRIFAEDNKGNTKPTNKTSSVRPKEPVPYKK